MLAKTNRLKASAKFQEIYHRGQRFSSPYFLLFVLPQTGSVTAFEKSASNLVPSAKDSQQVFGFVASSKVGGAVARNRSKRILRQAIRDLLPDLHGVFSAVIVASSRMPSAIYWQVKSALEQAFRKAALYNPTKTKLD